MKVATRLAITYQLARPQKARPGLELHRVRGEPTKLAVSQVSTRAMDGPAASRFRRISLVITPVPPAAPGSVVAPTVAPGHHDLSYRDRLPESGDKYRLRRSSSGSVSTTPSPELGGAQLTSYCMVGLLPGGSGMVGERRNERHLRSRRSSAIRLPCPIRFVLSQLLLEAPLRRVPHRQDVDHVPRALARRRSFSRASNTSSIGRPSPRSAETRPSLTAWIVSSRSARSKSRW